MANPTPAEVFGPAYSATATTMTFTFSGNADPDFDVTEITNALANKDTGDARTLIYGLLERLTKWYDALDPGLRPEFLRITSSGALTNVGGTNYVNRNYNLTFKASVGALTLPTD